MDTAKRNMEPEVEIWGTGTPMREFLFADDCADGLVFLMKNYSDFGHVNIGSGSDISIGDLARMIAEVVGFEGELVFDTSKPDGTPRKLMDVSKMSNLGWEAQTGLLDGISKTYDRYLTERGPQ